VTEVKLHLGPDNRDPRAHRVRTGFRHSEVAQGAVAIVLGAAVGALTLVMGSFARRFLVQGAYDSYIT